MDSSLIKGTNISCETILITDVVNRLWLIGLNRKGNLGFGQAGAAILAPIYTGITLNEDETVAKFYACRRLLAIYTSHKRLFVSRCQPVSGSSTHTTADRSTIIPEPDTEPVSPDEDITDFESFFAQVQGSDGEANTELGSFLDQMQAFEEAETEASDPMSESISEPSVESVDNSTDGMFEPSGNGTVRPVVNGVAGPMISINEIGDYLWRMMGGNQGAVDLDQTQTQEQEWVGANAFLRTSSHNQPMPKVEEEGIDLFLENVDRVTMVRETIFFEINGKINVIGFSLRTKDLLLKTLGLAMIPVTSGSYTYFELKFPFAYDCCVFAERYVYLRAGYFNHILTETGSLGVTWMYFHFDSMIIPEQIELISSDSSFYLTGAADNCIHKYNHALKDVAVYHKTPEGITTNIVDDTLFYVSAEGFMYDNTAKSRIGKLCEFNELMLDMVDWYAIDHTKVFLVNSEISERVTVRDTVLYVNCDVKRHLMTSFGFLYSDLKKIYLCTYLELAEATYGVQEIESVKMEQVTIRIYEIKGVPENVTDIEFNKRVIQIQAGPRYYHYFFDFESRRSSEVIEIVISDALEPVSKQQVLYQRIRWADSVSLSVNPQSKCLDRLQAIAEMLSATTDFDITFVDQGKELAFGQGTKREFFTKALTEFEERYLIMANCLSELNVDAASSLDDTSLYALGRMLHMIIIHTSNHLALRLPLSLVSEILTKDLTESELEYFASQEYGDAFSAVRESKDDAELLASLGFESYEENLKSICKYYYDATSAATTQKISKQIAKGFTEYVPITNLTMMNAPTLDYYLSGDYRINRELLIKNLKVNNYGESSPQPEATDCIQGIISTISEDDLAVLLRNWSGSTTVSRASTYTVILYSNTSNNEDIVNGLCFSTCSYQIHLNHDLLDADITPHETLIDMLTTPANYMQD